MATQNDRIDGPTRPLVRDALAGRRIGVGAVGLTLMIASFGVLGCASALAKSPNEIRVLLYDGPGPIQVGSKSGRVHSVERARKGGLSIEGIGQRTQWAPSGRGPWKVGSRTLRGRISVRRQADRIQVLNRIDLEEYVASTVGGEMVPSWPTEALRAQAVAARTYALHEAAKRQRSDWDLRATAVSQVYRGVSAETDSTRAAARSTRGQVLYYEGEPILAVFHSTAGGRTATAGEVWGQDLPYLRVVEVEDEDDAPHTYWRTRFEWKALVGIFQAAGIEVGSMESLSVSKRTASGRVEQLSVKGSERSAKISGNQLRRILGGLSLRSTLFEIRDTPDGVAFVGSGHGHGVGMSQWGARAMARRGDSYRKILARFYPGARLQKLRSRRAGTTGPVRLAGATVPFVGRDGQGEVR